MSLGQEESGLVTAPAGGWKNEDEEEEDEEEESVNYLKTMEDDMNCSLPRRSNVK